MVKKIADLASAILFRIIPVTFAACQSQLPVPDFSKDFKRSGNLKAFFKW